MKFETALDELLRRYGFAKEHEEIEKPLSYAFYYAWRFVDQNEKPRSKEGGSSGQDKD